MPARSIAASTLLRSQYRLNPTHEVEETRGGRRPGDDGQAQQQPQDIRHHQHAQVSPEQACRSRYDFPHHHTASGADETACRHVSESRTHDLYEGAPTGLFTIRSFAHVKRRSASARVCSSNIGTPNCSIAKLALTAARAPASATSTPMPRATRNPPQ